MASTARSVLFFQEIPSIGRRKARCAEVRSVAAAPPRFLGSLLSYPLVFPPRQNSRGPGPRDHRALGGNQEDIEPSWLPRHRACFLFKTTRTSCRRKTRCAEVRSMTATPPRLLGPRFRGGNERGGGEKRRKSTEEPEKREKVLIWRRFISSFSRRTPGPRDHRALGGNQKDI